MPAWETVPLRDPDAIQTLTNAFVENDYEIRSVLRVLFNSEFFREATFARVKSPAELVAGTVRLAGTHRSPDVDDIKLGLNTTNMGQRLLDPPSVEGWHTGREWINTAGLVHRVNFAVDQFSDVSRPGVRSIADRISARGASISPEGLVDACLDLIGPLSVSATSKQELIDQASAGGELRFGSEDEDRSSTERVRDMLQLIVATREYQMA